jgi:HEAT repeat protein
VKVAADLNEPWPDRQAAVHALGSADVSLPATAHDLLQSKDARIRAQMVRALIDRGEVAELAGIAKATGDSDATTRLVALQGVAHYQGLVTHRAAVLLRLSDPDPRVQALAAKAVGGSCADVKTTVVPKLKILLASTNFRVRHNAAMALLQLQDKSGQATMQADALSTNVSQARQAKAAYDAITKASW